MEKILTHISYYENKKKSISNWKISNKEKASILKFIEAYETGKITRRTATNPKSLIERLLYCLKFSLEHINKDTPTKKDMEAFFDNLLKDKYRAFNQKTKKYNGDPYSMRNKKTILDYTIRYFTWKFPNKKDIVEPLKIEIKSKIKEPETLTLEQIDNLYKGCKNAEERYFIAVLFSSGTRAEEFHNIRYSDIELPKGNEVFVKIRIRNEFSKTEGRTISLYYNNCLEAVREYLDQRKREGIKPEEAVFNNSYGNMVDWLNALGKRTIGRNVNYHLFRHTCATWLASRLNRQQLCIFFGWKFSSPMPDVYIKRAGVNMDEPTEKFKATEFEELKSKLEKEKQNRAIDSDRIEILEQTLSTLVKAMKN